MVLAEVDLIGWQIQYCRLRLPPKFHYRVANKAKTPILPPNTEVVGPVLAEADLIGWQIQYCRLHLPPKFHFRVANKAKTPILPPNTEVSAIDRKNQNYT